MLLNLPENLTFQILKDSNLLYVLFLMFIIVIAIAVASKQPFCSQIISKKKLF